MEKSWENFWTTGEVEDYLTYRNRVDEEDKKEEENKVHGTVGDCDGNGAKCHADIRIRQENNDFNQRER